jgi:hypothetical protein
VTSIGGRAFYACNSLTSVTVMDPACAIGEGSYDVFNSCANTVTLRGWPDSTAQAYVAASTNTAFESIGTGGTCGEGVYWSLDTTTWKLTISGSGAITSPEEARALLQAGASLIEVAQGIPGKPRQTAKSLLKAIDQPIQTP